jgi:transposase-like protein
MRRVGRYPREFRRMAVERLKSCDNIVALSQELGVHWRLLYKWRDQFDPFGHGEEPPGNSRESTLRKEVNQLKRVLVDKTLELEFFGSEQEFVGASPFIGFLSMGLFVSHGLRHWRVMFAGLFRDSWSLSGAAGIARSAPASGRRAPGTGWNPIPVPEIQFHLTGNSRTGQPVLLC